MVETVTAAAWWGGVVMGLLAVAVLVANNLRDIPTDEAGASARSPCGWATPQTRWLYRACVVGAFATIVVGVSSASSTTTAGLPVGVARAHRVDPAIRPMERVREPRRAAT